MASTNKPKSGAADQELVDMQRALLTGPTADIPHAETDLDVVRAFIKRRADQREAYGQFTATADIYDPMGNSKVFTKDMQVPVEHVEMWDLEATGLVQRVATPEQARRAFAQPDIGPGSLIPPPEDSAPQSSTTRNSAN